MKTMTTAALLILATIFAPAPSRAEPGTGAVSPGLVAHYFIDRDRWDGNWPDGVGVPRVSPSDWTFTEYAYSRVEPVVNHLFVRKGWFSVRWTGTFNPEGAVAMSGAVSGRLNINPNNSQDNEFTLTLANGDQVTRDQLTATYAGYSGEARSVHVKPKGNGNQNTLLLNGQPVRLANGDTTDVTASPMTVRLYRDNPESKSMGQWWIEIAAADATVSQPPSQKKSQAAGTPAPQDYLFELFADDGCRLFIDGKAVIDDWHACSEEAPEALRKARPVSLSPGDHRIVIEYFQGQSLRGNDRDPIVLYWACPSRQIQRQIVPAALFTHSEQDTRSSGR